MDSAAGHRRWRWPVAAMVIVLGVTTWLWVLSPTVTAADDVPRSDAVVLFVGGRGERLATALDLMAVGASDTLVIPNGRTPEWPAANELCAGAWEFEVLCPEPDPDTTRGEARTIAALADALGWESVVMVTSTYHVARAQLLLERCYPGDIVAVAADPGLSIVSWVGRVAHEWAGNVEVRVLSRTC